MSSDRQTKGLGRGLDALLGEAAPRSRSGGSDAAPKAGGVQEIDLARIRPNPDQPRRRFEDAGLAELAASIAERGILQPILLRAEGEGFVIIAGERRWRAAQRARLHALPAIVRDLSPAAVAEVALIENVQREDLNPLEEAEAYRQLISRHGHTQEGLGQVVHKSRSHIANLLRLLDLPEFVRDALMRGDISMGHARAVATAADPEQLVRSIIAKGWSVRRTEQAVRLSRTDRPRPIAPSRGQPVDADLAALERQLTDVLGLKVSVAHKGGGGTVSLTYSSLDQLDLICQRLSGEPI